MLARESSAKTREPDTNDRAGEAKQDDSRREAASHGFEWTTFPPTMVDTTPIDRSMKIARALLTV